MAVTRASASAPQTHKTKAINKKPMPKKKQQTRKTANTFTTTRRSATESAQHPTLIPKQEPTDQLSSPTPTRKRSKSPGIRLIGRRIYDSVNGKTCHQCRQKTMDFSVTCMNQTADKQCTIYFCHICLSNRYGEKAAEAAAMGDWKCPKCRGVCNCSYCMKKRGCCPTGILSRAAKANGFSSVSDMLNVKGSEMIKEYGGVSSKKRAASSEEEAGAVSTKRMKKNGVVGKIDAQLKSEPFKCRGHVEKNDSLRTKKGSSKKNSIKIVRCAETSPKKRAASSKEPALSALATARSCMKGKGLDVIKDAGSNKTSACNNKLEKARKVYQNGSASVYNVHTKNNGKMCDNIDIKNASLGSEILLPKGTELTNLADIDMPPEDIGNALQFLEFCEAFGQVLNLKKGQPENLLQEVASSQRSGQKHIQSVMQFHIKLLSIIQEDSLNNYSSMKARGRNLWVDALSRFISESQYPAKELLLGCSSMGPDEYEALTTSKKLRLLNFLCDEALGTVKLRSWIDKQNAEEKKKAKEKLIAEKEKEKSMKKKLQDEVAKATLARDGAPLSISEHQHLVSKIKAEAAQTLAETLKATEMAIKKEQRTDAVRSEPILSDEDGRKFWKLRSYSSKLGILLQDGCNGDLITFHERWFAYNVDEIAVVEKYISSPRKEYHQGKEAACPSVCRVKQESI